MAKPIPLRVVAGVAVAGGKMLLQKRAVDKPRPSMWENPGGKVEAGETEPDALAREWREELGHACRVGALITRVPLRLDRHMQVSFYGVAIDTPIDEIRAKAESSDVDWVDPIWAVKWLPLSPGTYAAFDDLLAYIRRGPPPPAPADRLVTSEDRTVFRATIGNVVRTFIRPSSAYYAIARDRLLATYGRISGGISSGRDLRDLAEVEARDGVSAEEFAKRVQWVRDNLVGEDGFDARAWKRAVRAAAAELRAKDGHL